jgi:hypothetical protein
MYIPNFSRAGRLLCPSLEAKRGQSWSRLAGFLQPLGVEPARLPKRFQLLKRLTSRIPAKLGIIF